MAREVLIGIVMVFVFAIGFFSFHSVFNDSVDKIVNNSVINSSAPATNAFKEGKTLSNRLDYIVFMVFIFICLIVLISGWMVGGNPLFMFLYFLIIVIATILASVFEYVWELVSTASVFHGTALFPITNHIITHLAAYTPIIGFLGVIAMFIKPFLVRE